MKWKTEQKIKKEKEKYLFKTVRIFILCMDFTLQYRNLQKKSILKLSMKKWYQEGKS